jgi:hypothetical protein
VDARQTRLAGLVAVVLVAGLSVSAASGSSVFLFKNRAAFCSAYAWKTRTGFVGCSARIHGVWRSVVLLHSGRVVRGRQAAPFGSTYRQLRTPLRGGPFVCRRAPRGVVCVHRSSGHGFGINSRTITVR